MIRELRDLSFTVQRCSAAIEMPDVIKARDELIHRFVRAAISTPAVAPSPTPEFWTCSDGADEVPLHCEDELPLYCEPSPCVDALPDDRSRSAHLDEALGDLA
jgi:hypothetical protein